MDFVEQLKSRVNIVEVIGARVRLRKAGPNRYQGLCPFHSEKTPSFTVHEAKQFYYCFGCQAKGDVLKFVMDTEGVGFYEAKKSLAERYGIPMPKRSEYADEDARLREALFRMHELAQENFLRGLHSPAGEAARAYLEKRGVKPETSALFGLGYSSHSGRALMREFEQQNFTADQMEKSGLVGKRDDGSMYDRFRNRLMFPIYSEAGKIIAFGGRALADGDNPKYLNSPETSIYKKSHVLYNLHRAKESIRKEDRTILVEGYMDAIGVTAAGFQSVVASCGTALTAEQVRALKRHSPRILVNFDPDAPGAKAAERSIGLLLDETMQVRIVELDGDLDPDEYCKDRGADAYQQRLESAKGYFYWLADRAKSKYDVHTTEGVVAVLNSLVPAVHRISDRLERMAVANDVAGYIGVPSGMVLDSFHRAAADRQERTIERPKEVLRADEKGLLNVLLSGVAGSAELIPLLSEIEFPNNIATRRIFQAVSAAAASGEAITFNSVNARLEEADQNRLAELVFAAEADEREMTVEYGKQCLESLRWSEGQLRRTQLKARVKEAERAGDLAEALRLAREL
jgi:DNA primase